MAVIRSQKTAGGRKVQAIIRKGGFSLSRVFWRTADANDWARRVEDAIASATPLRPFVKAAWLPQDAPEPEAVVEDDSKPRSDWTLGRALQHYGETVTTLKKGAKQELRRIKQWRADILARKFLNKLTTDDIQAHVNSRLRDGRGSSTVRHDVMLIRALFRDAVKLWKLKDLISPCTGVHLPSPPSHRERRLEDGYGDAIGEEARLRAALMKRHRGDELVDLFDMAIATGLRLSELLPLQASNVRTSHGICRIEIADSKNGQPRRVVLDSGAEAIARRRTVQKSPADRLFTLSESARARAWTAARKEAGVEGLRWHDLRHEALSRMASKGLHVGELQAQSGQRTASVLLRYVNAKASDIAKKLG